MPCAASRRAWPRRRSALQPTSSRSASRAAGGWSISSRCRSSGTRPGCCSGRSPTCSDGTTRSITSAAARCTRSAAAPNCPTHARRWFDAGVSDSTIEMLDEVLALGDAAVPDAHGRRDPAARRASRRGGAAPARSAPASPTSPSSRRPPNASSSAAAARRAGRPIRIACPFCGERERQRITSFATPDGTYRVTACQTCRRYLKTLDGRRAGRPVMPALDSIATLPARRGGDAARLQQRVTGNRRP